GALSYTRHGETFKNWKTEDKVIVTRNGPYDVEGGIEFKDERNSRPEITDHYTLCRCGASENKPFCNGRHWDIQFKDPKN
ncbi:MAG: CDGSH iron-sulfur domain-containing protein, partial [Candidatus Aminicenantes bacterium]|nr:CDGSH iron-sulfur domain-containing protein [Candidatus Aminicenantes bacterium]